jgi:hypothetical protein
MHQVQFHQYYDLENFDSSEKRIGAKFKKADGAHCAVRVVSRLGGDNTMRLHSVAYRGAETSLEGVTALVIHPNARPGWPWPTLHDGNHVARPDALPR